MAITPATMLTMTVIPAFALDDRTGSNSNFRDGYAPMSHESWLFIDAPESRP